jgi:mono/diheme cytochrome c family protein
MRWRAALGALLLGAGGLTVTAAMAAERPGDPEQGRTVFTRKHCVRCHQPRGQVTGAPALEELRRPQGAFQLAGRLWNHAPAMFTALTQEGIEWPGLTEAEMGDLMAYLGADPARDPAPDLFKGQIALVRKACLKCHSLRGEGGRVGPDLAEASPAYASASVWAATMWQHAPRMAVKALELGILYPRFIDDEMGNLVGFLYSSGRSR